jgi:hypothetical protein
MTNQFEPARLNEWLRSIASTEDDEVDCDALVEAAEQLMQAGTRGADLRVVLPHLAVHLEHCPECREWYDTIVELSREGGPTT